MVAEHIILVRAKLYIGKRIEPNLLMIGEKP